MITPTAPLKGPMRAIDDSFYYTGQPLLNVSLGHSFSLFDKLLYRH